LVSSLRDIESAVFEDHQVFGEKVALFSDKVSSFQSVSEKIDATIDTYSKQTTDLGAQIERIFVEMEKWKNQDFIRERLDLHKDLSQLIHEQQNAIRVHKANIGHHEGYIASMNQNIEELKLTEAKYRDVLKDLNKEIRRFDQVLKDLSLKAAVKIKIKEVKEEMDSLNLPTIVVELLQMI
jgi:chromosome segregation ATPase